MLKASASVARAKDVLRTEASAVRGLIPKVNVNFRKAVELLVACRGRVVVTGMGKAGIIGQKLSATMSSTGTPSHWVHPAEAIHGDLGRITKQDVVIALSTSGETEEMTRLLPILKRIGAKLITLTGKVRSSLANDADAVLDVGVKKEASSLNPAPTSSTTAMLAMSDALCVVVAEMKGFREKDFAKLHPGGQLGRQLLLRVEDIMRTRGANPVMKEGSRVRDVLLAITRARAGSASIVDRRGKLIGIFTDGDLRRHVNSETNLFSQKVGPLMSRNPKTIGKHRLAAEALQVLREHRIDELVVVDGARRPVGLLDVQDLLKAGIV